MAGVQDEAERVQVATRAEWREWLAQHHRRDTGVWLVTWKKSSGKPVVAYDDSVEEALCFGWIDSKGRKLDDERSMLWFAPRKRRSGWSRLNKERVEALVARGLMEPAGAEAVAAARADGSWSALDDVEAMVIPTDLDEAFEAHPHSRENFGAFPDSAKRAILQWIVTAKRAETRRKRIDETARLAGDNVRANQGSSSR